MLLPSAAGSLVGSRGKLEVGISCPPLLPRPPDRMPAGRVLVGCWPGAGRVQVGWWPGDG